MNSGSAPGSQASLREMNRLRVLDAVGAHVALTQVEIAEVTGLSAATVSNVVKELDAAGAVRLAPSIRNGRRAVQVTLAAPEGLLAAIVYGDREVQVAVGDDPARALQHQRLLLPADHPADEAMQRGRGLLRDLLEAAGCSLEQVHAVTVGVPAPIDAVSGQLGAEGILPGWRGVRVAEEMRAELGTPVLVDNTANLAALGESRHGALRGIRHGVYLKVAHGTGAGLVLDGEVFRGSSGTAGEIGHVTIDELGPVCRCGNRGCLDTYVGAQALLDAVRATHGSLSLRDLVSRALDEDPGCRRVIDDAGRHIGVALAGVVNLLNPEIVVVGGPLSRAGDLLVHPIRETLARCALPSAAHSVHVCQGQLADRAEVVGALALAAQARAEEHRAAIAAG
ncbi:MAG: ROK family transcriptional regulator [Dermatophilaceae bacterium]